MIGEVAEWLKAHAWKACIRETVSGVRIPSSPQEKISRLLDWKGHETPKDLDGLVRREVNLLLQGFPTRDERLTENDIRST